MTTRSGAVIREHLALVRSVLDRAAKKSRSQDEIALIDRLKKRITLLIQTMGDDALIINMTPFMMDNSDNILNRNEDFFLGVDARAEYVKKNGIEPPADDEYLFKLVDSIKLLYQKITQKEKDDVYADVVKIFNCCVEYQMLAPSRFK